MRVMKASLFENMSARHWQDLIQCSGKKCTDKFDREERRSIKENKLLQLKDEDLFSDSDIIVSFRWHYFWVREYDKEHKQAIKNPWHLKVVLF